MQRSSHSGRVHAGSGRRLLADCLALAFALSVAGCGNLPATPTPTRNPAETPRLDPESLAVVSAHFQPAGSSGPHLRGKGRAAAGDAAAGAAAGAFESISMGAGGDPLLTVLMLPIMVPVGLIAGAASGAASGSNAAAIDESARAWERATRAARLQERLRDHMVAEVRRQSAARQVEVDDALGPAAPDAQPDYRASRADKVLEVALMEIKFTPGAKKGDDTPYGLTLSVRARAVEPRTGAVLDELRHDVHSAPQTAAAWLKDDAALFTEAVDKAMQASAEAVVLEFFRLYYPPEDQAPAKAGLFAAPYYVLQPEYPPPPRWRRNVQLTGDLQPTFRWETFPRAIDLQAAGAAPIGAVSYDLAVYTVTANKTPFSVILRCGISRGLDCPQKPPFTPGPRIYLRTGLATPEHRLEMPLQACGQYGWTVRAHFTLDGHPRITEWSGSYVMQKPWLARRTWIIGDSEQIQPWNINWFLFRAPPAPGETACPD
ncbi:hypothetical protein EZJ19_09575 [Parasulfuritortus cantonensis]|uniref:Lipoprotein n=1 Tax=Parasulfuritortus cantonensis TaxID=2528202 RepID=A0A4R1BCB8_9PROT|nr:hypothetical protein [Parasulfuritortus cantonensis]TCJ14685.1 hypothetical protein EZJ19_09575 [Parasulfuritortus cantonensis]